MDWGAAEQLFGVINLALRGVGSVRVPGDWPLQIADLGLAAGDYGVRRGGEPHRAQRRREEGLGIGDCRLRILDCGVRLERLTAENAESAEKKWQERS